MQALPNAEKRRGESTMKKYRLSFCPKFTNPIKPLFETFDHLDKLFTDIEKQILKLGNKFINIDINKIKKNNKEN